MKRFLFVTVLGACTASSPSNSIQGTVRGVHYAAADAIALAGDSLVEIVLGSEPNMCVPPEQQVQHPGETALLLILQSHDASGQIKAATASGTYPVTDDSHAPLLSTVEANVLDAQCHNNASNDSLGTAGTVTLDAIHDQTYSGSFDVTLDSGDHITGTFSAPRCTQMLSSSPPCT